MNPTEQGFLDAIAADPSDVTSRLIYADWLEDRGDPRGEYLRVEHELRTTSLFTPRYWDLKRRRRELREMPEVQPEWREQFGDRDVYVPQFTTNPFYFGEELWRAVDRFIDAWHNPLDHESGNPADEIANVERRLGTTLPARLREWFLLAGRRTEDLSRGRLLELRRVGFNEVNWLLLTTRISGYQGSFGLRRQRLLDDDPLLSFNIGDNTVDGPSVSSFLIQHIVEAAMHKAVIFAGCRATMMIRDAIAAVLPGSIVSPNVPPRFHKTMFEARDLLCIVNNRTNTVCVAARTEAAYLQLDQSIRDQLRPC